MRTGLLLIAFGIVVSSTALAENNGNKFNPNVVNSPGPSGVGRTNISPNSPSVAGFTKDGKTTSTITGPSGPGGSSGGTPISTPAK